MTSKQILADLEKMVREAGSQKALAEQIPCSQAYLSDVLCGRRAPGPRILDAMKLRRTMHYEKEV